MSSSTRALSVDVYLNPEDLRADMVEDVRSGLTRADKQLSPVWFYDDRGSELFDQITRLPEYYLTRAERRLLVEHGAEIAKAAEADTLVELGAGTCDKSRLLLGAMRDLGALRRYVPLDVSYLTLHEAASALCSEFPGVEVHAVVGDFLRHVERLPSDGDRMVGFLGSTIGNLDREQRGRFLFDLDCVLEHGETFLLGTDLVKDPSRLVAAYDDEAGVTAAFNRNVLSVLNRELGAEFDQSRFEHVAVWDAEHSCIEMRLRSTEDQIVKIRDLDISVQFDTGEEMRTEISTKFTRSGVEEELAACGFVVRSMWEDPEGFLLTLATPYC